MSTNTPQPTRGSADDHRTDDDDDEPDDDIERATVPEGHQPGEYGDGGGGGTDDGDDDSGPFGGSLPTPSAKHIAIGAAAGIGLYLAYRYWQSQKRQAAIRAQERRRRDRDQSGAVGGRGGAQQPSSGELNIPEDPNDPLAADEAAGNAVFDGWTGTGTGTGTGEGG
jgi:hypothetical protein